MESHVGKYLVEGKCHMEGLTCYDTILRQLSESQSSCSKESSSLNNGPISDSCLSVLPLANSLFFKRT